MTATSRQAGEHSPQNTLRYVCIIKENVGRREDQLLPHFGADIMAPPLTLDDLSRTVTALLKSYVYKQKGGDI